MQVNTFPAHQPRRRGFLFSAVSLFAAACVPALQACGGGTSQASVRFVNGTVDYAAADFALVGAKVITNLANGGAVSAWVGLDAGDLQVGLYPAASSTAKLSETHSFATESFTSVLAYGALSQSVKLRYFDESNAAPDTGSVKLRLFQASPSLGSLDLYVTNASSLSGLSPTLSVSGYESLTDFITLAADAYRLRITAAGDQANVLYDLPAKLSIGSKSVVTLVVVPRATGSLPNLTALAEKVDASLLPNSLA